MGVGYWAKICEGAFSDRSIQCVGGLLVVQIVLCVVFVPWLKAGRVANAREVGWGDSFLLHKV